MKHALGFVHYRNLTPLAAFAGLSLMVWGCTNLAEDVATHMVERSLKHENTACLIAGDALKYSQCLHLRGGSCSEDVETPVKNAISQVPVTPVDPTPGAGISSAVAQRPAGDPARVATDLLNDPLLNKAAAVHDNLRGYAASQTPEIAVQEHGGGGRTVTLPTSTGEIRRFLDKVHSSIGSGAWDSYARITESHLASVAANAPGSTTKPIKTTARRCSSANTSRPTSAAAN